MNRQNRLRAIILKMRTIPRLVTVTVALLPFVVSFLRDRKRYVWRGTPRALTSEQHSRRAHRLVSVFAFLGPTFIKLSQVFAIREDILPKLYSDAFKRLLDQANVVDYNKIEALIEKSLGKTIEESFEYFDPKPLASASIAQVHRARYKGREVAVKIRRPGVTWLIEQDLTAAAFLLRMVRPFYGHHSLWRGLRTILTESKRMLAREVDFRCEQENAERIRVENVNPKLIIPFIYRECTREDVLVMQFCEGVRIDRTDELIAQGTKLLPLIETLMEIFLRQVLINGFFHADPHPGNIMIDSQGRVILLDFGMVEELSQQMRDDLIDLIMGAVNNDPDLVIKKLYSVGMIEPFADHDQLVKAAGTIISLRKMKGIPRRQVNIAVERIFTEMHELPQVHLPSQFVFIMRMGTLLEGIALKFDPNFSTMRDVLPIAKRVIFKLIVGKTSWEKLAKYAFEIAVDVTKKGFRDVIGVETVSSAIEQGLSWFRRSFGPPRLPENVRLLLPAAVSSTEE